MILTIIAVIVTFIGIVILDKRKCDRTACELGFWFTVCGGVAVFGIAVYIICAHVGVNATIEENRIEYESLCERQEIVESEYEDVSKSDVIKDIAAWNMKVYTYKHWAYNPWTSWFYPRRVADELKMIERKPKEEK